MERYFTELATAFVRGRLVNSTAGIQDGVEAGLRLHKFKANAELPRVRKVLGILRSLQPDCVLDVGSGRGTFLWPLLEAFPELPVTSIELSELRARDIAAVCAGGVKRLSVARMHAEHMAFRARSFDVVTILEVLEHLRNPQTALAASLRVARRCVLVSVPSTPDDNPEHLHLFTQNQLEQMALDAGAAHIAFEHVLNHRIALLRPAA